MCACWEVRGWGGGNQRLHDEHLHSRAYYTYTAKHTVRGKDFKALGLRGV